MKEYLVIDDSYCMACEDRTFDFGSLVLTFRTNLNDGLGYENQPNNEGISSWDVSNVTDMANLFHTSSGMSFIEFGIAFNLDLSYWDVSNVTNMRNMFEGTPFDQDISSWDVSNVTNMEYMFRDDTSFNQNLSSWDVSKVVLCEEFSTGTTAWTLPKPNFTNCPQ